MIDNDRRPEIVAVCGVIFLVFLVLKLSHAIGWSWWRVTAPVWGLAILKFLDRFGPFIELRLEIGPPPRRQKSSDEKTV